MRSSLLAVRTLGQKGRTEKWRAVGVAAHVFASAETDVPGAPGSRSRRLAGAGDADGMCVRTSVEARRLIIPFNRPCEVLGFLKRPGSHRSSPAHIMNPGKKHGASIDAAHMGSARPRRAASKHRKAKPAAHAAVCGEPGGRR